MNFSLYDRETDPGTIRAAVADLLQKKVEPLEQDYRTIYTCIDHTSLDATDHEAKIVAFAGDVADQGRQLAGSPHVAAVCVYPVFVKAVRHVLEGTGIRTASVAGAFPSAQSPLSLRLGEARYALDHGAEEIDMVISRGLMVAGEYQAVFDEIAAFREATLPATLKVILETGELSDPLLIARACEISLRAGADFIKTSTGKIAAGYSPEAAFVILSCIRQYHAGTGRLAGFKASGGIAEPDAALACLYLTGAMMGEGYLQPAAFRIGASRLTDKIAAGLRSG